MVPSSPSAKHNNTNDNANVESAQYLD
jgi:hypothetical protein